MNKVLFPAILVLTVGAMIGAFVLTNRGKTPEPQDPNIISRIGVHWHPELKVFVKGEEQEIPANIGITATKMGEVHTHAGDLPKIHYEMAGPVTRQEASLGSFFAAWGQVFNGKMTVTVNGQPNSENMNYVVKDGDKIEVRYE